MKRLQRLSFYERVLSRAAAKDEDEGGNHRYTEARRELCRTDLFYLLVFVLNRKEVNRDWLYDRCNEVQKEPDGRLDLWAREHFKSTIITYALTIQDVLNDPEITVGIFSFNRPTAKAFLRQIKGEFERNQVLKDLFPEILWADPETQAQKWSEDDGLIVKRKGNPKESTIEAWGLVDAQPTSKHYKLMVYDDVVTKESVGTPEMIKKVTSSWEASQNLTTEGGKIRYIGTRWAHNDTYSDILRRKSAIPRIYPGTDDGTETGEPFLWSRETMAKKRKDQGPYTFACFASGTMVLVGNWTERAIDDIRPGDEVVGYDLEPGKRAKLVRTKVVAINSRKAPAVLSVMESGRMVAATPDHKFFTGRRGPDIGGPDSHRTYVPLGFARSDTKSLISVYDPRLIKVGHDRAAAQYMAGIFDGEGAVSGNTIHLHQSHTHNPAVCQRIEDTAASLGFDFGRFIRKAGTSNNRSSKEASDYYLRGGRQEILRFLRWCNPARAQKIIDALFDAGTRNFGKNERDALLAQHPLGEIQVFNIQTETGNYIAEGFATKNCQILQNPTADKNQGFKRDWIRHYSHCSSDAMNVYILCDPANAKKKDSDYTSMGVIGLGPDNNYYLLDGIRDRLNLTERWQALSELHRRWKPKGVGYEQYGMQSDIQHFESEMEDETYRFMITPLGGKLAKADRIRRMVPIFESGRFWLPESLFKTDYEDRPVDIIQSFIEEEYVAFPVGLHDDFFDMIARIEDEDFGVVWPKPNVKEDRYAAPKRKHKRSGSSWAA